MTASAIRINAEARPGGELTFLLTVRLTIDGMVDTNMELVLDPDQAVEVCHEMKAGALRLQRKIEETNEEPT